MGSENTGITGNPLPGYIKTVQVMLQEMYSRANLEQTSPRLPANGKHQVGWLDPPSVISVLGKRGTGKTTLMRCVVDRLIQDEQRYLVLGPITPHHFKETQSLFSHVLAALQAELFDNESEKADYFPSGQRRDGESEQTRKVQDKLLGKLRKVRSYVARTVPVSLDTLVQSGKHGEDFAYQFTNIQDQLFKARKMYSGLVDELLYYYLYRKSNKKAEVTNDYPIYVQTSQEILLQQKELPLLVVALDDCDLFPELIRPVLDDILRLCESPRVVVLFASNEEAMYRIVAEDMLKGKNLENIKYLKEIDLVEVDHPKNEVALYINKVLPTSLKVNLTGRFSDIRSRLNFTPLQADLNNCKDLNLSRVYSQMTEFSPTPSLAQLMERFLFTGNAPFTPPNLLALFDFSILHRKSGGKTTEVDLFQQSPFCSLLPDTPRGLSYFYQLLARLYAELSKRDSKGDAGQGNGKTNVEVVLDRKGGLELFQIMLQVVHYGAVPEEYKTLDHIFRWQHYPGRQRMEIDAKGTEWVVEEGGEASVKGWIGGADVERLFPGMINDKKAGLWFVVSSIQKTGVQHLRGKTVDESHSGLPINRLMEFVWTVVQACGIENEVMMQGKMPPSWLPPPQKTRGMVYAAPNVGPEPGDKASESGLILILFPFWLDRPFPTYHAAFFYRSVWNDQVTLLADYWDRLSEEQVMSTEENQAMLDVMVFLHLHLLAVAFLWLPQWKNTDPVEKWFPTVVPITNIFDEIDRRQLALQNLLEFCEQANPGHFGFSSYGDRTELPDDWSPPLIEAHATFYLACAFFSWAPMTSYNNSQWIRTYIINRFKGRKTTYRFGIIKRLFHTLITGRYVRMLGTRPEGEALLKGIENLVNVVADDDKDIKNIASSLIIKPVKTALKEWENARQLAFSQMQPYPLPSYRNVQAASFAQNDDASPFKSYLDGIRNSKAGRNRSDPRSICPIARHQNSQDAVL